MPVVAFALALAASACGGGGQPEDAVPTSTTGIVVTVPPLDPTCVAAEPVATGTSFETIASGGIERSYLRHVPSSYEGVAMPVVVDLHDSGSTALEEATISGLSQTAEADGFVTLTPQATGDPPAWDHRGDSADVAFVADLLERAQDDFCLEPQRVYVAGLGDGALFAGRLACDLSDRIAAVGVVGDVAYPVACPQERPVPLLGLFGSAATPSLDPPKALIRWADRYGCSPEPRSEAPAADVAHGTFRGCEDGGAVESYELAGADAAWPNSAAVGGGDLLWAFFVDHPLRPSL